MFCVSRFFLPFVLPFRLVSTVPPCLLYPATEIAATHLAFFSTSQRPTMTDPAILYLIATLGEVSEESTRIGRTRGVAWGTVIVTHMYYSTLRMDGRCCGRNDIPLYLHNYIYTLLSLLFLSLYSLLSLLCSTPYSTISFTTLFD